jgi:hypothetical protein
LPQRFPDRSAAPPRSRSGDCGLHGVDPFQVGAGLKVIAIAFQNNEAKRWLPAQFIHCREYAMNKCGIIGIVDLGAIVRSGKYAGTAGIDLSLSVRLVALIA